jgi:PIN domain nuclease of toxin-antitoxin system
MYPLCVVDAHALIWHLTGNPRLGRAAAAVLQDPNSRLVLRIIVLAEVCWLIEKRRTTIPSVPAFFSALDKDERFSVFPLDREIVERCALLPPALEMHDRQIVATALILRGQGHDVRLLTCDGAITASGLVPIIW